MRLEDALEYVSEFYEIVGDEKSARQSIEKACRRV